MSHNPRQWSALIASLLPLLSGAAIAQSPVIEISGANFRPMPIAVPLPIAEEGARTALSDFDAALLFDLSAAGIFQLLDRKSFTASAAEGLDVKSIRFNRWSDVGAEALVKTQLSVAGQRLSGNLHLYSVGTAKEDLIVRLSVDLADARRLAHFFADALFKHFTREPGAFQTHLAYARKGDHGKEIWISDWDGARGQALTTEGLNLLPTVIPDGSGVAFTSYRRGKPEIFVERLHSSPSVLIKTTEMATGIAYSRDAKRIAYSLSTGESSQIWVAHADGSNARQITQTPFFINSSPAWSPDGRRIAFVSNRGGSPQIYTMNADGSEVKRLTFQGTYNQTPDWSPRGDLIAFTARDERAVFDIFTVKVDTGNIVRLTQDAGVNEEPSFSPNGRLIVFSSTRNGSSQLFVMTPDGNNQLRLPMPPGSYTTPAWGP